jgi:mono/diheme cytochrome c family protein
MLRPFAAIFALAVCAIAPVAGQSAMLHAARSSPGDLELGGDLKGAPAEPPRFVRYADLLRLPQETYTVSDDGNLPRGTVITGVALATLARRFAPEPESALIVAICDDGYEAHYPRAYLAAHHPLLVLRVNGKEPADWPKAEDGGSLGPYLISHPLFHPAFRVLSHEDEAQIPYGVVRLEFRPEKRVFGAIKPPGAWAAGSPVGEGYAIARQDCFRCHNMGAEGGTKAGRSWLQLAAMARDNPECFRAIVHDPASVTPGAQMPGEPNYDDATLDALIAYFKTFAGPHAGQNSGKGSKP